jgi:NADH-quinone oxidoreductase subunit G
MPWALSWLARCPGQGGLNAGQMLAQPMKALLLLGVEPVLDAADAAAARSALKGHPAWWWRCRRSRTRADADVMLPIAPFTETAAPSSTPKAGAGLPRRRQAAGRHATGLEGAARAGQPAGPAGLCAGNREEVAARGAGRYGALAARLDNRALPVRSMPWAPLAGLQRVADVPIYCVDPLVRRAVRCSSPATRRRRVGVPSALWQQLALQPGERAGVAGCGARAMLPAREDSTLDANTCA